MRIRRRRREPDKILTIPIADSPGSVIGHREAVLRGLLPGFFISPEEVSRAIGQDSVALALRAGDGRPRTERHEELRRAYGPYVNEVLGIGGAECRELGIVIASTEVIQGGDYKGMHTDGCFVGPSAHLDCSPVDATRTIRLMTVYRSLSEYSPETGERDASKGDGLIHERAQRTGGLTVFCGGEINVGEKTLKTAHRLSGSGHWARFATPDNALRDWSS